MSAQLVIGNWKMNPARGAHARELFSKSARQIARVKKARVVVCPPHIYLRELANLKGAPRLTLGAQDVSDKPEGSYTGDISVGMLKDTGVTHVIVGHSERRARGETDADVCEKLNAIVTRGLTAVVCVGEGERDEAGAYYDVIAQQLQRSLGEREIKDFKRIVIAYEPLWAIGADEAMDGARMHEMTIFIRKVLTDTWGSDAARLVQIIYGGSVDDTNVRDIIENGHVDGVLPGRASRDPNVFGALCAIVDELS